MKRKLHDLSEIIKPLVQSYLIFAFFLFAGMLPAMWIYLNAYRLKCFYLFAQLGHLALLSGFVWYLNRRKEMREIRMYLQDDEAYFKLYPRERKRAERAKRDAARREERKRQSALKKCEKDSARRGL